MPEHKTRVAAPSVSAFLRDIADEARRADCRAVVRLMQEVTGEMPKMWGSGLVGFGSYHYKYASGREGDWFLTGFAPRRQALTFYIPGGFERYPQLMRRLGKYRTGRSCLYVRHLSDVDRDVLRELVAASVAHMRAMYSPAREST